MTDSDPLTRGVIPSNSDPPDSTGLKTMLKSLRLPSEREVKPRFDPPVLYLEFSPWIDRKAPYVTACKHTYNGGYTHVEIPAGKRLNLTSYPRTFVAWSILVTSISYYLYEHGFIVIFDVQAFLALVGALALFLFDPLGKHQRAAAFHDEGYTHFDIARFECDAMYRVIMEVDKVSLPRQIIQFYGVRLFGWMFKARNKK